MRSGSWPSRSTRGDYPPLKGLTDVRSAMSLWLVLAVNSVTLGGLLFLLSAGFSLIFGLMRIPNLTHGSFFMLGGYFAASLIEWGLGFWPAAMVSGLLVAALGGLVERLILRRLAGGGARAGPGDPRALFHDRGRVSQGLDRRSRPDRHAARAAGRDLGRQLRVPDLSARHQPGRGWPSRWALWALLDRTRLGAMIRAGRRRSGHGARRGASASRASSRSSSAWALGWPGSPASSAGPSSPSIRVSTRRCSRWPSSWSSSGAAGASWARWSAASSSASSTTSARRCSPSWPTWCYSFRCSSSWWCGLRASSGGRRC